MELDVGKLAIWHLHTYEQFHGTWLSDDVPSRLGGFLSERQKPDCPLIGQNGNIYTLMGIATQTLRENGLQEQAEEMLQQITGGDCHSYDEALCILEEYVNITPEGEMEMGVM